MADRIGTEVSGYRIESLIARGGMGEVYLASQSFPERKVALKLLPHDLASDPAFRERFIRESNAAASLEHPNIVPVYGAGESDGELWIAMRFVDGEDLRSLLEREGPLAPERAAFVCAQIADALEEAHEHGLVHRDVKPGNILVAKGDRAYLSDFGLIRPIELDTSLTKTGQLMGTVDYVAPEQIKGQAVDGRADIYSLGCVLYECLTGEPPFRRETEVATLYAHLEDRPPKPSDVNDLVSGVLDAVVARALTKRPDDRFQSAARMGQAAREATKVVTPRRRRRWVLPVGLIALLVLAAGVVAIVAAGGDQPEHETPATPTGPPSGSIVEVVPDNGQLLATVPHGITSSFQSQAQVEVGEGGIWSLSRAVGGALVHIDAQTDEVRGRIPTCGNSFAFASQNIWIGGDQGIERIDPATDKYLAPVEVPGLGIPIALCEAQLAAGGGRIWAALGDGRVLSIDADRARIEKVVRTRSSDDVVYGGNAAWLVDGLDGTIARMDSKTYRQDEPIAVAGDIDDIAVGEGSLWILDATAGTLTPLDMDSETLGSPIRVGNSPVDVAVGLGSVWVANQGDGTISQVDPVTGREVGAVEIGSPVAAVAVDESTATLWVAIGRPSNFG